MRRIVRDYVAAAVDRARPELERHIARHLVCSEPFPFTLAERLASIHETRRLKITPRFRADFPPVDVVAVVRVSVTAGMRQRGADVGTRTFALDVALHALGTPRPVGTTSPRKPRLTAWWGFSVND